MKKTLVLAANLLLFASVGLFAQSKSAAAVGTYLKEYNTVVKPGEKGIVIENVRIIDGNGNKPIENGFVVIQKGIITEVGSGSIKSELRKSMDVINGEGKSLMPGLIDAHLHSVNDYEFLQKFLGNGVTTMRDPGHPFTFYQAIHFTDKPLPRIFLTGPHLDSHPAAYSQQATLVKSDEHAKTMVENNVKNGGTGVKIYFRLPLKYYSGIIETARTKKIPVFAHLELVSATDAINAGINGIEHVTSFGTSIAEPSVKENFIKKVDANNNARSEERYRLWASLDMNSPKVKEAIKLAVEKKVFLCPTLATFEKQAGKNSADDYKVKGFQNMLKFVEMAHKAGVKIVVGSHSSSEYSKPGWTYQREMELLAIAGLTPLEIIKASTVLNADYFGNSTRLGSINPGKAADLLLVNGNPSENIADMYNINAVMLNGAWVKQ